MTINRKNIFSDRVKAAVDIYKEILAIETEYRRHCLKEFTHLREIILDYFLGKNTYNSD